MSVQEVRIPSPAIRYNVAIEGPTGHTLVNWGNDPGWLTRLRAELDEAARIGLIPKDPKNQLPVVTVRLDGGRRWILFSRVFGQIAPGGRPGPAIRVYAIGWQATVRGRNVKNIIWVYPNGTIECAEEPGYAQLFLGGQP